MDHITYVVKDSVWHDNHDAPLPPQPFVFQCDRGCLGGVAQNSLFKQPETHVQHGVEVEAGHQVKSFPRV